MDSLDTSSSSLLQPGITCGTGPFPALSLGTSPVQSSTSAANPLHTL